MVSFVGITALTDRLKACCPARAICPMIISSSIARTDGSYTLPSKNAACRISPTSIGLTSSLDKTSASLALITSPFRTTVLVSRIFTLPASIAAGIPACCSSPTIGPGLKLVGPFSTMISSGAFSPGFAAILVFVFSSFLNNLNGFSLVKMIAECPEIKSPRAFTSPPISWNACSIRVFLVILSFADPFRFRRICWSWDAGIPYISTRPVSAYFPISAFISSTSFRFHAGR